MNRSETTQTHSPHTSHRPQAGFARSKPAVGRRAVGRRGESLASPRDRQRLRERNRAERARVEGMLATEPIPVERRGQRRALSAAAQPFHDSSTCPVCGDGRVVMDEVIHVGTLKMSECLHCEHRWTERPGQRWVALGNRMGRSAYPRGLVATAQDERSAISPA